MGRPRNDACGSRDAGTCVLVQHADDLDDAHPYVGSVSLDGKSLDRAFITHQELMAGGELRFTMQAMPNKGWPGKDAKKPYSMSALAK